MPVLSGPSSNLTPRERDRLAGILARLASPHDGERAAAALLASAFMAKHGLSWSDLTIMQGTPAPTPAEKPSRDRRHNPVRPWRGYCRRHKRDAGAALSCMA